MDPTPRQFSTFKDDNAARMCPQLQFTCSISQTLTQQAIQRGGNRRTGNTVKFWNKEQLYAFQSTHRETKFPKHDTYEVHWDGLPFNIHHC